MNKKKILLPTLILIIILLALVFIYSISKFQLITTSSNNIDRGILEPNNPINIADPPFASSPLPENEISIKTVIDNGNAIPIDFRYNDPKWNRPAYKDYWHSSYYRWSYVPNRIHYAMHKVFATYRTASIYYDFIHNLGISEESTYFKEYQDIKISPYEYIEVVVMNTNVEKIYTFENQVVIVGKPQRSGLQAIIIPTDKIKPIKDNKQILIQLATPDGYEIDYTTIYHITKEDTK